MPCSSDGGGRGGLGGDEAEKDGGGALHLASDLAGRDGRPGREKLGEHGGEEGGVDESELECESDDDDADESGLTTCAVRGITVSVGRSRGGGTESETHDESSPGELTLCLIVERYPRPLDDAHLERRRDRRPAPL